MFDFDYIATGDMKEHNSNWLEIPNHPYKTLIIGGSVSGKTNSLLTQINHEPDIDNVYSYAKDPYEAKYQVLINKKESTGLKYLNDSKDFIEYSNDIYKNIEEYNPNKKRKILNVFYMIADILNDKELNPIVTELIIRVRKLNICLAFITQSYFAVLKNIRLNSTHYLIMKIPNKKELIILH